MLHCKNLFHYSRFQTREVKVGEVGIGGNNPVRIQSMTTTDTLDTKATVEQSIRMIEAGCELVRITAPSLKEAQNLEVIKRELRARGYRTPLIADIHFTPNAAELAAKIVEKVRVNPGNYADKKKFESIDYSDAGYEAELERIRKRFTPLVKICKEHGTAMRIGTNHGSLSDRIMSRYGDTPLGMVESAFEFLRICEENSYYDVILSMKASNPQIMVQAYRLLVAKMRETNRDYPLHLGVTEAGEGEDGRIKSALGIGTLLEDGIGDTVRVSLTEDPEFEIPVAKELVDRYASRKSESSPEVQNVEGYNPFEYHKRESIAVGNTGGTNVPRVIADLSARKEITAASLFGAGYSYSASLDKWNLSDLACDFVYCGKTVPSFDIPGTLGFIVDADSIGSDPGVRTYALYNYIPQHAVFPNSFVQLRVDEITSDDLKRIGLLKDVIIVLDASGVLSPMLSYRKAMIDFVQHGISHPVIFKSSYAGLEDNTMQLYASTDMGSLLIDGFGDGIWLCSVDGKLKVLNETSFGILQAARARISKTEYISCPSCGRTLFDLQETTAKIRKRTDHLKGIKIGIMGCIVNGPGEMADADYGYVGTGVGKITLYKGREVVKKNIDSEHAVDELVQLIRDNGDWVERS